MKKIFTIALGIAMMAGLSSCADWLDVNTNPDSPNNGSVQVQNRLPWIQRFYMYSAGTANMRTSCMTGLYFVISGNNNALAATWSMPDGSTTTVYQTWFVGAANNVVDLYSKAEKEGAYHYMAAADVIHALGFMNLADLHGEMPYTEALSGNASPAYDDGKTIFYGCLDKIDEAIELFSKPQEANATPLSAGDMWCHGDTSKWLKLCYGLKARWLLKLSKKSDLFDANEILNCLAKGPQSNDDNIYQLCYNVYGDPTDFLLGDPFSTNGNWDCVGYGSAQRVTKFHKDMLTNMRGAGVEDPRMTKIIPAYMSNVTLAGGKVASFEWFRSEGMDVYDNPARLLAGGAATLQTPAYAAVDTDVKYTIDDAAEREKFISTLTKPYKVEDNVVTVTYTAGSMYVGANNYLYAGDTVYVNYRSNSQSTMLSSGQPANDVNWYTGAAQYQAGVVGSTGTFDSRPDSDFDILTYHEMCFVKAEVYMRMGDRANALSAYKEGIRAHMNRMQKKLREWEAGGYAVNNPDMTPMDDAAIEAYLNSAAVAQSAGELTMSDIMLQKYVAMGCSIETYNDMRRFNYSAGNIADFGVVYPGYKRSPLFTGQDNLTGSAPTDPTYWIRRWRMPATLELSYNETNAKAANKHAYDKNIWCYPVWWDCATDDEYYGYIR